MAKNCSICGKKLGLLAGKVTVADGIVCTSCWINAGQDMGFLSMCGAGRKTVNQVRDLIEIEILKREAEKAGLAREIALASEGYEANEVTSEKSNGKSEKKEKRVNEEVTNPIDIMIEVKKDHGVSFCCEGKPVISFKDLIEGREMIIGDGFMQNECKESLPEIRIVCEFDPPIIDPGLIYYEEGTFEAGVKARFEIDDPPVNLEEYSKIKRTRKGKVRFTLFVADSKICTEECDMTVKPAPAKELEMLMGAIAYEEEKNSSGPVNVFLYARDNGKYEMDLLRNPELLYSMYSNGKEQLIGDVFVTNETDKMLEKVRFEASFTSDILKPMSVLLGDVAPGDNVSFEVDDPAININLLESLTDVESCTATYRLFSGEKQLSEAQGKITICPYDQWNAALILLPAYMTPNHPNVINVLQNASKWMLVNGMNPSLEGYQSDAKRVEEMVGAVYNAVKEANIIYSNPPASFFGPQRIRLCESVLENKFATCLDMTILFASCLESFGLHPVLITAPGHIFAGVWLTKQGRLQEPIISDAKMVQKYIKDKKLIAIECTAMTVGKDIDYKKAKKIANDTIKALADNNIEEHECIDVQIARSMGVRPLPVRVRGGNIAIMSEEKNAELTRNESKVSEDIIAVETEDALITQKSEEKVETALILPRSEDIAEPTYEKTYIKSVYKQYQDDLKHISIDNFYDKKSKSVIKNAIADIVEIEGPISQPALMKTLIGVTSLGRVGKQMAEYLDKLVATADVKITRQNGVRFLWKHGSDPLMYMEYREKNSRNPEEICKYEMKNAVCILIQENGPLTKDEIVKGMVHMFGYSRTSKKIEEGALAALKAARELKAIEKNEQGKFDLV